MVEFSENLSLSRGRKVIQGFLKTLPETPGVYRMIGANDEALYIGKAKALKKRVVSYTNVDALPFRLKNMVAATVRMECVLTQSEAEALLLEANLIKSLKPRFNILLRDDKSFPYIHLTGDHDFPMVRKHRGAKRRAGEYYGPFAGVSAVNRTLDVLQRLFMLRNCSDTVFANRSRPCLQYHIKRCSAPCVGLVSEADYAAQVGQAEDFLNGNSRKVQERLASAMETASAEQAYEKAAAFRDKIQALNSIQSRQDINFEGVGTADVFAIVQKDGRSCVQVFFFRAGQNYGHRAYFPRHSSEVGVEEVLATVLAQFYMNKTPPRDIYVSEVLGDHDILEEALSDRLRSLEDVRHGVSIHCPVRGEKKRMIDFAVRNARSTLERHVNEKASVVKSLDGVAELFDLGERPSRIEVYDNSHISGTNMVGAMIVAGEDGFDKKSYRTFNIREAGAADDYGMMKEVLGRRFRNFHDDVSKGGVVVPDLLLIDGGAGQLSSVMEVLGEMGVDIPVVAIAKGEERNAGRETFFRPGDVSFDLPVNDPVLHYLQRLRDEAHRFAIGAHRRKRAQQSHSSGLDEIPGIGPARKKALLRHFGSLQAVSDALPSDLALVEGVSQAMAQVIYDFFHSE